MDGRSRDSLRPFVLDCDVVPSANGSARLRMDKTDVIVAVKAEIGQPDSVDGENLGRVNINVDCSANMCGQFERGEAERLGVSLSSQLRTILVNSGAIPRHKLCLVVGKICWILNIDVMVNSSSGNLLDIVALTIKAALRATVIPHITIIRKGKAVSSDYDRSNDNGDDVEIEVSDDPNDSHTLSTWDQLIPYVVSICRVGNHLIADPTLEEEKCIGSKLAMAFSETSRLLGTFKLGSGSFSAENVVECLSMGNEVSKNLTSVFDDAFVAAITGMDPGDDEDDNTFTNDEEDMDGNETTASHAHRYQI